MNCKNCNTALNDHINFCPECGAKIVKNRLTLKNIAANINEQFLNIDNTFLKTFIHLFTHAEIVVNGFIHGTRKKYINVIQYFAVALTLVGIQVFLMNTFFRDSLEFNIDFLESIEKNTDQSNNPFKSLKFEDYNNYQSIIYILSVPISTIATWAAYYVIGIRQFNFTEHLVINLYYSAQVIIISAVLSILFLCFGLDYLMISSVISVFTFAYFFYILKQVFNTTFWNTVLHYIVVMMAYFVIFFTIMFLFVIVIFVYILLNKETFVNTI